MRRVTADSLRGRVTADEGGKGKAVAQLLQNFAPARFSVLQLGQIIIAFLLDGSN
jgi:hypothetical protein